MARVMRREDGAIFEVYDSRKGAAYEEFLIYDDPNWLWLPTYLFSEVEDEHIRVVYVPNPESEEGKELPKTGLPSCEYFYPSVLFPHGDPRRGCERVGEWAIWREDTHSAQVTIACNKHVGHLLALRGKDRKYHVWALVPEVVVEGEL